MTPACDEGVKLSIYLDTLLVKKKEKCEKMSRLEEFLLHCSAPALETYRVESYITTIPEKEGQVTHKIPEMKLFSEELQIELDMV